MAPHPIAIFASGSGSNARRLMEHFQHSETGKVALVVCNKPRAGVLEHAHAFGVPTRLIEKKEFYETENLLLDLQEHRAHFLVLAGFLWLIPPYLLRAYPRRIVNIHPALLPKYGGKGMYGHHVHEAVKQAGEKESGITIHYVDEHYDEGDVVFQTACPLDPADSPEQIAARVLALEHHHYPEVVEQLLKNL